MCVRDLINRMFRARNVVLINRDNNPDLLISITSAGVKNGKKDKSGEKIGDDLRQKLTEAGVVFPEELPSETVDPSENADSTDDKTVGDEQGQED